MCRNMFSMDAVVPIPECTIPTNTCSSYEEAEVRSDADRSRSVRVLGAPDRGTAHGWKTGE